MHVQASSSERVSNGQGSQELQSSLACQESPEEMKGHGEEGDTAV